MMRASGIVWDACGILNLVATHRAADILSLLGCPSYIIREVRTGEVFYIRPLPEEDPTGALILVDLTPLMDAGLLTEVSMSVAEQPLFVRFASDIDDGEARSAAVAMSRGLGLATDDRATLRLLRFLSPSVEVLTTPGWVKYWADAAKPARDELTEVIRCIEVCARFFPPRAHPLKDWWNRHSSMP